MTDRSGNGRDIGARLGGLAGGLGILVVLAGPVAAVAEDVTVSGCPQAGAEAGCITLKAGDGTLYNISAAEPKPEVGVPGTVTGAVSQGASMCMQGIILSPATWQPEPGASCPHPEAQ